MSGPAADGDCSTSSCRNDSTELMSIGTCEEDEEDEDDAP